MRKSQSDRWHKMFTENAHSERLAKSRGDATVARAYELLNVDRRMSEVRLLGDTLNISKSVIHLIVNEELQMQIVCGKLVPKVLTGSGLQRFHNRPTVPSWSH